MSDSINLMIRDDGVATIYDDTYDITIHCESEEEQHKVVELLNNAQPEQRWIPCSERLPEEDGDYLVLYYTRSQYKPYMYDVMSFANDLYKIDEYDFCDKEGQKGWFYCDREYGYCEDTGVTAWMPLPPCYAKEKE